MNTTPHLPSINLPDVRLATGAAPVACVDVGGTKVTVSVVNERGVQGWLTEPTVKEGASDALGQQVVRMIGSSCAAAGILPTQIAAVGIASCGPFVLSQGLVELAAPNICGGLAGAGRGLPNRWTSAVLEAPVCLGGYFTTIISRILPTQQPTLKRRLASEVKAKRSPLDCGEKRARCVRCYRKDGRRKRQVPARCPSSGSV